MTTHGGYLYQLEGHSDTQKLEVNIYIYIYHDSPIRDRHKNRNLIKQHNKKIDGGISKDPLVNKILQKNEKKEVQG